MCDRPFPVNEDLAGTEPRGEIDPLESRYALGRLFGVALS
jgi:hypothetical protein